MTEYEYNILDNMIDDYTKTGDYKSVVALYPEIEDKTVLDFLRIVGTKYDNPDDIIKHLKYIRDEVVMCDCDQCEINEKETEQ